MLLAKVSNKIVETLSLIIGALRRIKQSAPPPYALHSNLGCLLQVAHTVSQHCLEGIVSGKLLLSLLKSEKCRRALLCIMTQEVKILSNFSCQCSLA